MLGESQIYSPTNLWLTSPGNHLNFNSEWNLAQQGFARTPSTQALAFSTDRTAIMLDVNWELSETRLDHSIYSGESLGSVALPLIW